ncbi:hypothetical protein C1H46_011846 [Malus baccata]|uniref:Ubiquitin-conjugating enzyme E2C-binding protein n=1 Tax=Malus baccata TaxID=106549 RepID=A0A540MW11_MALBA|nr:hypothetical protein C1H46_011846 [Malus baccata]
MSMELQTAGNPRKWRFTWEAQSHIPILRLFLFDSCTKPSTQCRKLTVHITPAESLVLVSWAEDAQEVSLRVPMPRVLVDAESPVSFSALDDHIEVKLVLLLPVDHPIVLSFDSLLSLDGGEEKALEGELKPLSLASEVKSLSSSGVHFYCRNCSFKLTASPLSQFVEMPSVNWREVADNWFGACCCSFGGISEKLVVRYANSYVCAKGVCLVNSTNITLCKDDLVGFEFPYLGECQRYDSESDGSGDNGFTESELNLGSNLTCNEDFAAESKSEVTNDESNSEDAPHLCSGSVCSIKNASTPGCCNHMGSRVQNYDGDSCRLCFSEISLEDQKPTKSTEILKNHESFLNGYLENIFMVRSSNLSIDVEWVEFFCPQCSSLLGAYPCDNGSALVDGGVRLFKCNVSTGLPVGEPADIFRKYTLESMFANQLLECAKDELSFRTVVSDLKSRSPRVQIVLMNTNSWSGTGHCLAREGNKEPVPKIDLHPVIKVLFSQCSSSTESQARMLEDSVTKDVVDEVFMLTHQIEELIETLSARKDMLPPSCSSLQGLSLSSMPR